MAPKRKAPVGPEPGFDAIRRAYKADSTLGEFLVLHVKALPRIARVRAEAEQRDHVERARLQTLRHAARMNATDVEQLTREDIARYFEVRAEEQEKRGRALIAEQLREVARRPDPAAAFVDADAVAAAEREAHERADRAMHEPGYALELAARLAREVPRHMLGVVEDLPTVLEKIQTAEAERRRDTWRGQLALNALPEDVSPQPDNDIERRVLSECVEERRPPAWVRE